jgi:hypothetical protein
VLVVILLLIRLPVAHQINLLTPRYRFCILPPMPNKKYKTESELHKLRSIRVTDEMWEIVKELAEERNTSASKIVERAIYGYIREK